MSDLARRQEELVRALVTGGRPPEGFDARRLRIAEEALLRKRAGEVAAHLPLAAATLGPRFVGLFRTWARGRERSNSADEARAFVEHLTATGEFVPPSSPPVSLLGRLSARARRRG